MILSQVFVRISEEIHGAYRWRSFGWVEITDDGQAFLEFVETPFKTGKN